MQFGGGCHLGSNDSLFKDSHTLLNVYIYIYIYRLTLGVGILLILMVSVVSLNIRGREASFPNAAHYTLFTGMILKYAIISSKELRPINNPSSIPLISYINNYFVNINNIQNLFLLILIIISYFTLPLTAKEWATDPPHEEPHYIVNKPILDIEKYKYLLNSSLILFLSSFLISNNITHINLISALISIILGTSNYLFIGAAYFWMKFSTDLMKCG